MTQVDSSTAKKTIVVTGGAGFIGSHLSGRLAREGHRVIVLDNYFTGSRASHISGVEYREGHTKDIDTLVTEMSDLIYHLGEYSRVEKSFDEPALVWDLNKDGTFGVLEFWRKQNQRAAEGGAPACKLVYAGSSTKFADGGMGRDQSPYAWTKASNTELVRNYGSWYDLPYAITYFYNVYGPGERSDAYGTVIEIFKERYLAGRPIGVVAPGTQKRNFTHIDDIVDGLVRVGAAGFGDDYGLGDEREYSILEIAKLFGKPIEMLPERAGNRMSSIVDTSKSKLLGWEVKRGIEEYIKGIISPS